MAARMEPARKQRKRRAQSVKRAAPLWRCPVCGQRFVSRNLPHSCDVVGVDAHFRNAPAPLREAWDAFVDACSAHGDVIVNATRSRISIQRRMRFAGVQAPRKTHLVATFVLTRAIQSARLMKVEYIPPYYFVHSLKLTGAGDVDDEVRAWLSEAARIGAQEHVRNARWPKLRAPPAWVSVPKEVKAALARGQRPDLVR